MLNPLKALILTVALALPAKALVLEDLIDHGTLEATLSYKKVGYYVGSFDPLHLGHDDVANLPIQQGLCDYVLIYPAWGGDDNYKKRVDIKLRQDMVFSAFADHPRVIVTRLSPQDMQRHLTNPREQKSSNIIPLVRTTQGLEGKPLVEVALKGLEFIGIIGSDTALSFQGNPKAVCALLTGIQIPEKYHNHSLGGLMAFPGASFIVAMRTGDDISPLNNHIIDRPIIAVIKSEKEQALSSTGVKKALKNGESIDTMVSLGVAKIIKENGLYQG